LALRLVGGDELAAAQDSWANVAPLPEVGHGLDTRLRREQRVEHVAQGVLMDPAAIRSELFSLQQQLQPQL
jgi:hypothetical protein